MNKQPLNNRLRPIAENLGLSYSGVKDIVADFVTVCQSLLLSGYRVEIPCVVSVVPDVEKEYNVTFAYICYKIADLEKRPRESVYIVINEYINSILKSLVTDKTPVDIRGLVTLKPFGVYGTDEYVVHGSISTTFKDKIKAADTTISSVRVHTARQLRNKIKNFKEEER